MKIVYPFLCLVALALVTSCSHTAKNNQNEYKEEALRISNHISNEQINGFTEDRYGQMWISTFRGLNKFDGSVFHQYFCTDDSTGLPDNQVACTYRDSKGQLWVATVNGLCRYNGKDGFTRVNMNVKNRYMVSMQDSRDGRMFFFNRYEIYEYTPKNNSLVVRLKNLDKTFSMCVTWHIDDRNTLWVRTTTSLTAYSLKTFRPVFSVPVTNFYGSSLLHGHQLWLLSFGRMALFDTHKRQFVNLPQALAHPAINNDMVSLVHPYGKEGILLNTYRHGLWFYDRKHDKLINQADDNFPFKAPDFNVTKMYTDSKDNLWLGSDGQGFEVIYKYKDMFNADAALIRALGRQNIKSVATDGKSRLWIVAKQYGLCVYDTRTHELTRLQTDYTPTYSDKNDIYHVSVDKDGMVWTFTMNGVNQCSYDGTKLHVVKSYPIFLPMEFTQDHRGIVWISTTGYVVYIINPHDGTLSTKQLFPKCFTFISGLTTLRNGDILISAFSQPIMLIDGRTFEVRKFPVQQKDMDSCILRSVYIPTKNLEDSHGNIWMGTVTNGLLRFDAKTGRLTRVKGLSCSDVSSIEEDRQGNIWVSTMDGLNKVDHRTGNITVYHESDGIGGFQFNDRSSCRMSDGTLVFGGTHGLTMFNPQKVTKMGEVNLMFENLKVHNNLVIPGKGAPISESMETAKEIRLGYRQNSFAISFAAIDFNEYKRIHYYYRMEGHDNSWTDADGSNEAHYSNLPPGNYTFRVKIVGNNSNTPLAERTIKVCIEPEPWKSWQACCLYLLLAIGIIWYVRGVRSRIAEEKRLARKAEDEREQEQRINKMNMNFFANISHEFRTPLTMIAGPLQQLRESKDMKSQDYRLLDIIARSVKRMLRLVNQILDFNKLENDTLRLHVEQTDIVAEVRRSLDIFKMNAEEKGIAIYTHGLEDSFLMWLDADKLEKIFNNLMSNAMKFTPRGGAIDITFDTIDNGQKVSLEIADSGKGIPESELENIFKRYYQLNNQSKGTINWGSGIGLYYARELARLHHGSLKAGNRTEGQGAVFTLVLPTSDKAYTDIEKQKIEGNNNSVQLQVVNDGSEHADEGQQDETDRPKILLVDDDTEVVHYLRTLLAPDYKVLYCFDAESALKMARTEDPSLILSDVIMPGISGYELCRRIKDDLQTSHIPVILVTAKITDENKVEGLNSGADAYVTKPFAPKVLLALVKSLLTNRERIRTLLNSATETDKDVEEVLSAQDKHFMDKLYQIMEKEMANAELDVNKTSEMMCVSRTKLYYKVKGLTGESPSTFFKTYKLNKAAELIKSGEHTVSEIAYMTGFNTLSHFSTSFKKQFGCSPSEYGRKKY
jgi:signal transduction histidine kinase/DNA-binding response OmpR family regulator/ligand-binding sensor domain-containing protein